VLILVAALNAVTRPTAEPVSLAEAVGLTVGSVDSSAYRVTADLVVRNRGLDALSVVDFATTGVAMSVVGGLPERVPGRHARTLRVHLEIPACAGLPGRFGGFGVTVERAAERIEIPFASEPGTPLYREMAGLTDRICAGYRNRFSG